MKNKINVEVEFDGSYGASIKELPGCIALAETYKELRQLMNEAVEMHLDSMREHGDKIPVAFRSDYELIYKLSTQALLVAYDGIFTKTALSRMSGINEKQLWHYSMGAKRPRQVQRERISNAIHQLGKELLTVEI
jgi:predicted RNase H-like HicB family nuclease